MGENPTRLSLQAEVTEATVEVTKRLNPPVKRAANLVTTRVNRPRVFQDASGVHNGRLWPIVRGRERDLHGSFLLQCGINLYPFHLDGVLPEAGSNR